MPARAGPALAFAPEREALPDDIALAYSAVLKAPEDSPAGELRAALDRVGRRLRRQQSHQRRPRRARQPRSLRPHRGLRRRPRLSPHPGHGGGLRARRRRHQLEPGAGARRRQERRLPGRRLRCDALRARPISPPPSPTPTTGCRPTASPLPATTSPPSSTRRAWRTRRGRLSLRHALRRAHALRRDPGAELPHALLQRDRRQRRRLRARLQLRAPAPTRAANWARASTACWRSIPARCSRCAGGSPGRTTG